MNSENSVNAAGRSVEKPSPLEGDICSLSATNLAREISAGRLSAAEVTDNFLERIAHLNPRLNAFVDVYEDQARSAARAR